MTIAGPTMFFHRTEKPRIVTNDDEYAALGDGWADTPAAFYGQTPPASDVPAVTKARIRKSSDADRP